MPEVVENKIAKNAWLRDKFSDSNIPNDNQAPTKSVIESYGLIVEDLNGRYEGKDNKLVRQSDVKPGEMDIEINFNGLRIMSFSIDGRSISNHDSIHITHDQTYELSLATSYQTEISLCQDSSGDTSLVTFDNGGGTKYVLGKDLFDDDGILYFCETS